MKVKILKCPSCKQEIYSRAQHDCHSCKCKATMVDGGRYDYTNTDVWVYEQYCGNNLESVETRIVEIDVTAKILYDDWNESLDKYGVYD